MNKNVLITGGAGFIGSHLCDHLVKDCNVICLDNLTNSTQRNIDHLLQYLNFEFLKYDINNPIDLESFKELEKFEVKFKGIQEIYHLACPTSAKDFEKYKIDTLNANSLGMKNVLDVAVKYKSKFLFGSSSVVYGSRKKDSKYFIEEDLGTYDHLAPRACYNEGKRFAESCVDTYGEVRGLDVKIARIFRTFGPRQKLSNGVMLPDFVLNAINNEDLVLYGDENLSTTLCYIDDLVDGLVKLMDAPKDVAVVNLGNNTEIKLADVAKKIIELTGSKSQIIFKEPLPFMMESGIPDTRKAKEALGWFPLRSLDEGLVKTIEYIQAHRAILGT